MYWCLKSVVGLNWYDTGMILSFNKKLELEVLITAFRGALFKGYPFLDLLLCKLHLIMDSF